MTVATQSNYVHLNELWPSTENSPTHYLPKIAMAVPRPIVNVLSGAISGSGNKQLQDADARKQLNSNIFYTTSFSTTK
jgi:hypothetical protein